MEEQEYELPEEKIEELLTDQEEDFTAKTLLVRKSLRFSMPLAILALVMYFVLRTIDTNKDFNPVNATVFTWIGIVIMILGVTVYFFDISTNPIEFSKKEIYKRYKLYHDIFDFVSIVPYLLMTITLLNMFFISFSPISGTSMEPNYSDDEAVVFSHMSKTYNRFDIVIIFEESLNDPYLIKRVIGLPGETVRILNNEVYINGDLISQDFIDQDEVKTYCYNSTNNNDCTIEVPMGTYFVLGDNRDGNGVSNGGGSSIDSRSFGPVSVENIFGKVIWKFKDNNLLN